MFCIFDKVRLRPAILAFVLAGTSCARHYRAEGVILKINEPDRTVTISHRAIPHYMEAMAMPFAVRDWREIEGLAAGARVTFRLGVGQGKAQVSRVRRESIGIDDIPIAASPSKLAIGEKVPDFVLHDQRDEAVRLSEFRGRPVVLDFIYTRCPLPDVCPRLSANMARLQKRFGGRVSLLSITLDPQFDTPEVLAGYARRWHADPGNWRFLTGSAREIQDVAAKFGLVYWPEEGLITHTAVTALIDSEGKLAAVLEGSRFTSQQLLDLVSATVGLRAQPPAPDQPSLPAP